MRSSGLEIYYPRFIMRRRSSERVGGGWFIWRTDPGVYSEHCPPLLAFQVENAPLWISVTGSGQSRRHPRAGILPKIVPFLDAGLASRPSLTCRDGVKAAATGFRPLTQEVKCNVLPQLQWYCSGGFHYSVQHQLTEAALFIIVEAEPTEKPRQFPSLVKTRTTNCPRLHSNGPLMSPSSA